MAKIQTEEEIITKEDAQFISKLIAGVTDKEIKSISKKTIQELNRLFKQLEQMLYKQGSQNKLNYYSSKSGWAEFLYNVKGGDKFYPELFSICLKILEIIRTGESEEGYTLIVYETQQPYSGMMNIYFGTESNVPTSVKIKDGAKELDYVARDIQKTIHLQSNTAFARHYNNFYNVAMDIKEKKEREGKKDVFNEGHIIEAFQRHLYFQHKIQELTPEIALSFNGKERLTGNKWVPINLYYAMNSAGWWTGGDVGKMQIKGDNKKLASIMSVKAVASTLLEIYKDRENLKPEERFKQLFTQGDQEKMAQADPNHLANLAVNEIIDLIGNSNKKKK